MSRVGWALLIALWIVTILWARSAEAQVRVPVELNCFPAPVATAAMERMEMWPVAHGVATGALGQVWANTETGDWAFLVRDGNGLACILLAGEDFEVLAPPVPGEDG